MRWTGSWLLSSLTAAVLVAACDSSVGQSRSSDVSSDSAEAADQEVTPPPAYYAVIVDEDEPECENTCAFGADIDAVQLSDAHGNHVAWLAQVDGKVPITPCGDRGENCFPDVQEAVGPSDMEFVAGYVSLNSGHIIGEFEGRVRLEPEHTLTVYEAGSQTSSGGIVGKDELYAVYLAEDITCAGPNDACAVFVGHGHGESDIPLAGAPI